MRRLSSLIGPWLFLAACPSEKDDSATSCADLPPAVEVGNGNPDHVPFTDGDPIVMVHGPQGGWHVWVSLALTNFDPEVSIHVTLTDLTRAEEMAELDYSLVTDPPTECVSTLGGLFGFLPYDDLDTPEDESPPTWRACDRFEVCAEVTDGNGATARDCLQGVATPDPADGTVSC